MAEERTVHYGITVHQGDGGNRVEIQCMHQNGVLYAIPADASWVCSKELLHIHSLAGFFEELVSLNDQRVQQLMQQWGLYFRSRPIAHQPGG